MDTDVADIEILVNKIYDLLKKYRIHEVKNSLKLEYFNFSISIGKRKYLYIIKKRIN